MDRLRAKFIPRRHIHRRPALDKKPYDMTMPTQRSPMQWCMSLAVVLV